MSMSPEMDEDKERRWKALEAWSLGGRGQSAMGRMIQGAAQKMMGEAARMGHLLKFKAIVIGEIQTARGMVALMRRTGLRKKAAWAERWMVRAMLRAMESAQSAKSSPEMRAVRRLIEKKEGDGSEPMWSEPKVAAGLALWMRAVREMGRSEQGSPGGELQAAIEEVKSGACWSGLPLLAAGLEQGFLDGGWKPTPEAMSIREAFLELERIAPRAFEFQSDTMDRMLIQQRALLEKDLLDSASLRAPKKASPRL